MGEQADIKNMLEVFAHYSNRGDREAYFNFVKLNGKSLDFGDDKIDLENITDELVADLSSSGEVKVGASGPYGRYSELNDAFNDCYKLRKITISGAVPNMTSAAFEGCKNIDTIIIPNSSIEEFKWSGMECALIKGFIELVQSESSVSGDVVSGGNEYIKSHNYLLVNNFYDNMAVLTYITQNGLLSAKTADAILENAQKKKKTEIISLIHAYKNDRQLNESIDHILLDDSGTEGSGDEKPLAGLTFVVTGDVNTFASRNELKLYIEERGGKLTGNVSSKTNYLITNTPDSGTTKNIAAKCLGVPIITEAKLREMAD